MSAIFYWSSQASLPIDEHPQSALLHRLAHVVAYAVLAVLVRIAVEGLPAPAWLALGVTVAYGVSDEVHQSFVPGRTGTLRDVMLDSVAGAAALLLVARGRRFATRAQRQRAAPGDPAPRP